MPVLRWVLADDEWDWVETSLRGRMDGATKLFFLDLPADGSVRHGFDLQRALVPALAAARVPGRGPWSPIALPDGLRDVDALAGVLGSFGRHVAGSSTKHVGVVLAPTSVADLRRYREWLLSFVTALVRFAPGVRVVLLDDTAHPQYAGLASESAVHTVHASLSVAHRTEAMVEATTDPNTPGGALRRASVQLLHLVREGRVDDARHLLPDVEMLAARASRQAATVPLYFSVAASLTGQRRHSESVECYRAAERAAERAQRDGDPDGLRLRIFSRFGVGGGLLAAPGGQTLAATYYQDTVPFCAELGDVPLQIEANRCAAVSHELAGAKPAAFDACVRALALVDALSDAQRDGGALVPLVDMIVRLVKTRELAVYQPAMHAQLRRRLLRGSSWE
ncbi:MAG: hypothetical protein R3B40_32820 [Polyangiales bacterium]